MALLELFDRKLAVGGELGRIGALEVMMRPAEVFVRPLAHEEAVTLKCRAKQAKHFATRERAAILLASNVGNSVPQMARAYGELQRAGRRAWRPGPNRAGLVTRPFS